jgi:hypothetical protein
MTKTEQIMVCSDLLPVAFVQNVIRDGDKKKIYQGQRQIYAAGLCRCASGSAIT